MSTGEESTGSASGDIRPERRGGQSRRASSEERALAAPAEGRRAEAHQSASSGRHMTGQRRQLRGEDSRGWPEPREQAV